MAQERANDNPTQENAQTSETPDKSVQGQEKGQKGAIDKPIRGRR